jgi:plasmid maintenance system antidote protein VapI
MEAKMNYTFEILCVSPILHFFNQQQTLLKYPSRTGVEYLGNHKCTLDSFVKSVEDVSPDRGWNLDQVVDTVISFWVNNSESIKYWQRRLEDAGKENLLVARVADIQSLQATFELLLEEN